MSDVELNQSNNMCKQHEIKIQKSAIRRLAHDANRRLTKVSYEAIFEHIKDFLLRILANSAKATCLANKKTITQKHVKFGVDSLHLQLPKEIYTIQVQDLLKLKRCNYKAPPTQRKQNLMHVEIPCATFSRTLKCILLDKQYPNKLTQAAKNYLQIITEHVILKYFGDKSSSLKPRSDNFMLQVRALEYILNCTKEESILLERFLFRLFNCIASLLLACSSKKIDENIIKIAGISICPSLSNYSNVIENKLLDKYCDRMLRGQLIDVRIMKKSYTELSSMIQILLENSLLIDTND